MPTQNIKSKISMNLSCFYVSGTSGGNLEIKMAETYFKLKLWIRRLPLKSWCTHIISPTKIMDILRALLSSSNFHFVFRHTHANSFLFVFSRFGSSYHSLLVGLYEAVYAEITWSALILFQLSSLDFVQVEIVAACTWINGSTTNERRYQLA